MINTSIGLIGVALQAAAQDELFEAALLTPTTFSA